MKPSAKRKTKFVKIVSRGKKKVRRKLKRTRRRIVRGIVWSVFLFGAGIDKKLSELKNGIAGQH